MYKYINIHTYLYRNVQECVTEQAFKIINYRDMSPKCFDIVFVNPGNEIMFSIVLFHISYPLRRFINLLLPKLDKNIPGLPAGIGLENGCNPISRS